jgi:hypothetical protein
MSPRALFLPLKITLLLSASLAGIASAAKPFPQQSSPTQEQDAPPPKEQPQTPAESSKAPAQNPGLDPARDNHLGLQFIKNMVSDQRAIWTSPAHIRLDSAAWLVPFAGLTAGFIETDRDANSHLSSVPSHVNHYSNLSNYGIAGMAGVGGGLYLLGRVTNDDHKQEAGLLSGEAAIDGLFVTTVLKYSFGRERPNVDNFRGKFWQGGDSFPSDHATAAWAIASVLTHEYPGPLTKILAYGAASAISFSRVEGQKHFSSDVFVGAGIGWLVGWQVYRAHHNPDLNGGTVEDLSWTPDSPTDRQPSAMGSPYVPIDSWVYPLFDRLIGWGLVEDAILGQRPWTRLECARMVNDVGQKLQDRDEGSSATQLYETLRNEFLPEIALLGGGSNRAIRLESVYARVTDIAGPPLVDGYHFGQTIYNDYGRPYERGFNSVAGFSGWATSGRWVVYVRGEYQHSPSAPANTQAVQTVIDNVDLNPVTTPSPVAARDQARLMDAYVGLTFANFQLSYGQESQWWGPGESGPLLLSDNAYPMRMFHIDRVTANRLPGILKLLGPIRSNAFFGKVQGSLLTPSPFFHGEKLSFKPTKNLEFGFTRTVEVGGPGRPFTLERLFLTYFSVTSYAIKPANKDPGKRDGGFDFNYRLPFVRKWLSVYNDSLSADDPSPLAAPRRAAFSPGLYLTQFPWLSKLDLRVEAPLSDTVGTNGAGHYVYWDNYYHDLYTNRGVLMGDWVGRDGSGIQAWSRYWLSARSSLQFGYRHEKVDVKFIPNGGTINDASIRADFWFRPEWSANAFVQYEQWRFPLLAPGLQKNVTASLQITYFPKFIKHP